MAFVATELSQMAFNSAGLNSAGGTAIPRAGNHLWFYRNSAGDDETAANFFNDYADIMTDADLLWVVDGGATVTGGTLYSLTTDGTTVTLITPTIFGYTFP